MNTNLTKKALTLFAAGMLTLALTACGNATAPKSQTVPPETTSSEVTVAVEPVEQQLASDPVPEPQADTEAAAPAAAEEPAPAQESDQNIFSNPTNYQFIPGEVNITPGYLYWENGELYAQAFVTNGKNEAVYDVIVNQLMFENEDGIIADAAFGVLKDAVIPANSYIVWTFHYGADVIASPNAKLGALQCTYSVHYSSGATPEQMEAFRQQTQAQMEEFQRQSQEQMEEFQRQGQAQMEEFQRQAQAQMEQAQQQMWS